MKRIILFLIIVLQLNAAGLGLGIIIGDPTGFSLKNWIARRHAIDFGIGWSFTKAKLHVVSDYLFHFPEWLAEPGWYPYLGLGGSLKLVEDESNDEVDINIGARFGIGIEYIYQRFGFFGELYPVMYIVPESDFSLEGGIGARFYLRG